MGSRLFLIRSNASNRASSGLGSNDDIEVSSLGSASITKVRVYVWFIYKNDSIESS